MSQTAGLKRSLAIFGLSLGALTTTFNTQAADTTPATPQANIQPVAFTQAALNEKLTEAINDAGEFIGAKQTDPSFNPYTNIGLQSRIDNIKAIVKAGANPNHYVEQALVFPNERNMTPLGAAILLAAIARRVDLVETFIQKGADIRQRSSGGSGPMDIGIYVLQKAQEESDVIDIAAELGGGARIIIPASAAELENVIKIIKVLHNAGLRPEDATMLTGGSTVRTKNYATLGTSTKTNSRIPVNGLVLRNLLYKHGLMSSEEFNVEIIGDRQNAASILSSNGITDEMIESIGGKLNPVTPDLLPGGSKLASIGKTTTIENFARIFMGVMDAPNLEAALVKIATLNKIEITPESAKKPLLSDLQVELPISPKNQITFIRADGNESLADIATIFKDNYYKKGLTIDQIAADIAIMNELDPGKLNDKKLITKGRQLIIGMVNDNYTHLAPMSSPGGIDTNRKVDLIVVEAPEHSNLRKDLSRRPKTAHAKLTYSVAANTGYALNRQVDMMRFHALEDSIPTYPNGTSNALRVLLNTAGTTVNDRLMFSVSEASFIPGILSGRYKSLQTADNIGYEGTRLMLDFLEKSKPIVFTASGNWRMIEGPYIQSHIGVHSPRSILVGAAGLYESPAGKDKPVLTPAPYTSYSADICTKLPMRAGDQMEGTSFATPETAAIARQFNEWYGNRLSFEEIIAAGMMSTDRNYVDYNNPYAMQARMDGNKMPQASDLATHTAKFNTNGAGLPHNPFCGTGITNPERWKAGLDKILTLKNPGQDAVGQSFKLAAGPAIVKQVNEKGRQEYTYRLRIPENMTLGRLTFLLPQDRTSRGEIVVITPSGFEMQMPRALTDVISTQAFAYEDVKAGDFIEIRTNYPLGETAGMILRGHAPGNAIALLRDKLRAEGALPEPLKEMSGDQVIGPSKPITVLRDNKPTLPGFD